MRVTSSNARLDGVRLLDFEPFTDHRGFFYESYSQRTFADLGIDLEFVQDNHSSSGAGVIRGLHYQGPAAPQWRLVRCPVGEIFDVIVDIDEESPTFGQWEGFELSAQNKRQLLIPPQYAHGFAVVSPVAEVQYKCTGLHSPADERALNHADPALGIAWPAQEAVVSAKDAAAPGWDKYRANPDFPRGWAR